VATRYAPWLRDWAAERGVTFGEHYWPHDGDRESLPLEGGTLGVAAKAGHPAAHRGGPGQ
jgi:hypothetical protein